MSPSKLNLDVSAALEAVVAKAMAKRREERFQSAREFAEALKEAAKPRPAHTEDMPSMPTITDTVFEARDQAPRTPPKTPSEMVPETAPNKESVPDGAFDLQRGLTTTRGARQFARHRD